LDRVLYRLLGNAKHLAFGFVCEGLNVRDELTVIGHMSLPLPNVSLG